MKFSWKVFISTLLMVAAAFACGAFFLIDSMFAASLETEANRALQENQLMQLAYETGVMNYTIQGNAPSDEVLRNVAEQIGRDGRMLAVRKNEGGAIYDNITVEMGDALTERVRDYPGARIYRFAQVEGTYAVQVATQLQLETSAPVLLETARDVSGVFAQRSALYAQYRLLSIAIFSACAIVMAGISLWMTRPLRRLSATTRSIAEGHYGQRAAVRSHDEIGAFSESFNKMADALEDKMVELERVARQREDFVASFAHELKTPLTAIIGYADMLRSQEMSLEQSFTAASYIFSEGKRLESLSLKLLDLIVLRKQDYTLRRANGRILLEDIAGLLAPAVAEYGMLLRVEADDAVISVESDLIKTLLVNLVDNARKASRPGDEILLFGRFYGHSYVMGVTDHGYGIPPEELDKITEAFYMVDKSRARAQNGAGLGLALCQSIAQLHEAHLQFESQVGVGTTVTLPLEATAVQQAQEEDGDEA
nr:HAMP domain-containing sensor histidine kinase [Maliibacterium massiliense]